MHTKYSLSSTEFLTTCRSIFAPAGRKLTCEKRKYRYPGHKNCIRRLRASNVVAGSVGMDAEEGKLTSVWAQVGGLRMHARAGLAAADTAALPVVLVHGLVVSSIYMIPLAERLAVRVRVYAPDLPG